MNIIAGDVTMAVVTDHKGGSRNVHKEGRAILQFSAAPDRKYRKFSKDRGAPPPP